MTAKGEKIRERDPIIIEEVISQGQSHEREETQEPNPQESTQSTQKTAESPDIKQAGNKITSGIGNKLGNLGKKVDAIKKAAMAARKVMMIGRTISAKMQAFRQGLTATFKNPAFWKVTLVLTILTIVAYLGFSLSQIWGPVRFSSSCAYEKPKSAKSGPDNQPADSSTTVSTTTTSTATGKDAEDEKKKKEEEERKKHCKPLGDGKGKGRVGNGGGSESSGSCDANERFNSEESQKMWEEAGNETDANTSGMRPHAGRVTRYLKKRFPKVKTWGTVRGDSDGVGTGHADGLATDIMINYLPGGKDDVEYGDKIAKCLEADYKELKVSYIIWQQKFYMEQDNIHGKGKTWAKMADRGSHTQNHMDHVHLSMSRE